MNHAIFRVTSRAEAAGLLETAHLLRPPKNARRLLTALRRARTAKPKPEPLGKLRQQMGLGAPELKARSVRMSRG